MITMRRQLLGLGFVAASSLLAMHAAKALNGPTAIQIDGGPIGALQISGGADGYGYYVGPNPTDGGTNGAEVGETQLEIQKTSGILQFTVELASTGGATTLGTHPGQTSITNYTTGPLYAGYITIAPTNSPVTVSIGQVASLEGYEGAFEWGDPSQLVTALFYVQNSQNRGVSANYTAGPLNLTLTFGDGWDSGVFNFLQGLGSYTINATNNVNVYFAANLGRTGLNTFAYGQNTTGGYGAYYMNSDMIGGWYSYTMGNLNVIPEVQYVTAKQDYAIGLFKQSSNLGATVMATYAFGTSPYSIGGWVDYENSNGPDNWVFGTESEAAGFSVAPAWQYKDLFARVSGGMNYLLRNKYEGVKQFGYGSDDDGSGVGHDKYFGTVLAEAGVLF